MGALISGVAHGAFWGMAPVFGQRTGLTDAGIAAFIGATILGGAALQPYIGWLSDRFDRRVVLTQVCFASTLTAVMALALAEYRFSLVGLTSSMFLYGGLSLSVYGLSVAHANDHLQANQTVEAARGLLLLYGGGAVAGPALAGLLMDAAGRESLFGLFAASWALLGGFALYRMRRRAPVPLADQEPFVVMERTSPVALEMLPQSGSEPGAVSARTTPRADAGQ